jgi:signal transduction histidine kinase
VRVSDDGCGIDERLRDEVFLPRERGRTDDAGAGLGLAIARGIIDAHRGTIVIERSTVGTTVAVTLPVDPADAERGEDA